VSKLVPLTQGHFAIIDDEDHQRVSQYKWTYDKGYVVRKETTSEGCRKILLHRFITSAPHGSDVDHQNGNPLDNTKQNLRICTRSQNSMNRGPVPKSTSKYKGVFWHKRDLRWIAKITVKGKQTELGRTTDETEAAKLYDRAALIHFGEFAYLNFC
jgi:hypothetical protein